MSDKSPWLVGKTLPGDPPVRLYCFPHSGGLPGEYVRWGRELPGVQLYGVCLPGRGERVAETPPASMQELVDRFLAETDLTPPFVLFGHSLGALVAFEVARELAVQDRPLPERLIVSAYAAPHLPRTASNLHALPDASLARAIGERYGAIPPHVMADPELLALLLPAFRADFTILETYRYKPGTPLTVPLEVFGAEQDAVSLEQLELWRDHTTSDFRLHRFAGGHFYFRENPRALIEVLGAVLGV
ncbi:thioesterase II family protein [Cystobacter fuscus]|uniref:thioesterase II family protein n=1 Tax=Cystobacter fuscus TaxID=43 RepID=UPI002B2BDA75|nr:thioesterase [Cystobacter fuscus]